MYYSKSFLYRWPVAVVSTSTGAKHVTFQVPSEFDLFWDNVLSSGNDIVVTLQDGRTLPTNFYTSTFNYSAKTCTIEVNSITGTNATIGLLWLYWGYASASNARTSFVSSSPDTGYIYLGGMVAPIVKASRQVPGTTYPKDSVSKHANDEQNVFWVLPIGRAFSEIAGRDFFEEPEYVAFNVKSGGVPQAAMFDQTLTRFVGNRRGGLAVRTRLKAGTSGTNYLLELTVKYANSTRLVLYSAQARVRSVAEQT